MGTPTANGKREDGLPQPGRTPVMRSLCDERTRGFIPGEN